MMNGKKKSLKVNEKQNQNEIICILYIENNNYDKEILLFNNNEDNKNEFIDNIFKYI